MKARSSVGILTIGTVLFLGGCTTTSISSRDKAISLEKVESLRVGVDSRDSVREHFGNPDLIAHTQGEGPKKEAWLYFRKNSRMTRLSLVFDPASHQLESVGWFTCGEDDDLSIEQLRNRYSRNFAEKDVPNPVAHLILDKKVLIDESAGMRIEYDSRTQKVSSISWHSQSARQPAKEPGTSAWTVSAPDHK